MLDKYYDCVQFDGRLVDVYSVDIGSRSRLAYEWRVDRGCDACEKWRSSISKPQGRDKGVWSVAQGGDYKVVDNDLPELVKVQANNQSKHQKSLGDYLDGSEAIQKMQVAEGMQVNLFASEEMFPRLIQSRCGDNVMAVDT